jgi:hypothetical protein
MRGPAALIGRTANKPLLARHYLQIGDQMLTLGSGLKNSVMMKLTNPPTVSINIGVANPMPRSTAKYVRMGGTKAPATAPIW